MTANVAFGYTFFYTKFDILPNFGIILLDYCFWKITTKKILGMRNDWIPVFTTNAISIYVAWTWK